MKYLSLIFTLVLAPAAAMAGEFKPYVGIFGGFNSLSATETEADKSGFNLGAKAIGSYYWPGFLAEGSLGYQFNQMKGQLNNLPEYTITNKTVFLDLDARYRVSAPFSLGPTLSVHMGSDNSYSETEGSDSTILLAGLKAAYEFKAGRLELALLQNLSQRERVNSVVNVGFSIPLFSANKASQSSPPESVAVVEAKRQVKDVQVYAPVLVKPIARREEKSADVKVTLKMARIGFQTNSAELDPVAQQKLARLGKFLARNPKLFGRLKIGGHTDQRGTPLGNLQLSQDRADAVMKVFAENGVTETKMSAYGYGQTKPLDKSQTDKGFERNRRTEIEFYEVSDRATLNQALEQLLK